MYKIYEIRCNITDEVYFGKTTHSLEERLSRHKRILNTTSKEIISRGNYVISQINECDTEEESVKLEGYYIRTFPCVNRITPGRTKKEYRETFKKTIQDWIKEYHKKHKDKIKEYHKQYHIKNRDIILKRVKEWSIKNSEILKEKRKKKYTCECGTTLTICKKKRHEKTKKHQNYLNSLNKDAISDS